VQANNSTLALPNQQAIAPRQATAYDLFDPDRYAVLERMAATLIQSGMLPQALTKPAQVITIMLKAYELSIPPLEGLNGITVIQGKPSVSPQLMLSLINRSGLLEDLDMRTGADGATCTMTRKGRKPHTVTFGPREAQAMGLAGKDNYKKQPGVMYQWRAVAACARVVFPDVISGLYTAEEMGAEVRVLEDGTQEVVSVPALPVVVEPEVLEPEPVAPQAIQGVTRGPAPEHRTGGKPISDAQISLLSIALKELDFKTATEGDKQEGRSFIAYLAGLESLESVKSLTSAQASKVISALGGTDASSGKYKVNKEAATELVLKWTDAQAEAFAREIGAE
jgi:hypothetical protein